MFTTPSMPKSLGMIHTVNYSLGDTGGAGLTPTSQFGIDLPGQLTNQLQRMVRACQYFKVVGIDLTLNNIAGTIPLDVCNVTGVLQYYAPTRGRCEALKNAYRAVMNAMKIQGIKPRNNRHYDFRVPITDPSALINGADFLNAATFDGTNLLTMDVSASAVNDEIMTVYNKTIQPQQASTVVDFATGFGVPGQTGLTPTDFVLQEGEFYEASLVHTAETTLEEIPFSLSYGIDSTTNTAFVHDMEWRPDPALYLAVLTGQFIVKIVGMASPATDMRINAAFHVSGWKSVLGSGKKRRRSKKRRSSKKKS